MLKGDLILAHLNLVKNSRDKETVKENLRWIFLFIFRNISRISQKS